MKCDKYASLRIFEILQKLIIEERWIEFSTMASSNGLFGQDWNKAVPDDGGTLELIEMTMKSYKIRS